MSVVCIKVLHCGILTDKNIGKLKPKFKLAIRNGYYIPLFDSRVLSSTKSDISPRKLTTPLFQETLHNHYSETVSDVKQSLLVSQPPQFEGQNTLSDIMSTMKASLVGKLKLVLVNVKEFISADITFANKPYFRFVTEGLVLLGF